MYRCAAISVGGELTLGWRRDNRFDKLRRRECHLISHLSIQFRHLLAHEIYHGSRLPASFPINFCVGVDLTFAWLKRYS